MDQFSRGQMVTMTDIDNMKMFECVQVVGGSPCRRLVVINSTSIFSFEPTTTGDLPNHQQQGTLLSQRSLLEIGRVTFLKTQSFTVHFKTSYGGDQVEYKFDAPLDVVAAIRAALDKVGVKGKHTQNANASANSPPQRRIQGGSFRERPRDAIRRLEGEMVVRPTLTIVRAIMDRYRRLIDAHIMDPSTAAQKEAEVLMHQQQEFLMREDVTRTLNSEAQILKQREKRSDESENERNRSRSTSSSKNESGSESTKSTSEGATKSEGATGATGEEKKATEVAPEATPVATDAVQVSIHSTTTTTTDMEKTRMEPFAVGADCYTIMGKGTILEIRTALAEEGEINKKKKFVVELHWVLAYNCKVLLYTTLDKLTVDKKKNSGGSHERGDSIDGTIISRSETMENKNSSTEGQEDSQEGEKGSELSGGTGGTTDDSAGSAGSAGSADNAEEQQSEWPAGLSEIMATTAQEEEDELDQMMAGYSNPTGDEKEGQAAAAPVDCEFVGVPYRRQPGEIYYCHPETKSQINHARVAEQGVFLGSGRHQTLFVYDKDER